MYFDYLTLAGLLSALSLAGILYCMTFDDITKGRASLKERGVPCGSK